MNLADIIAAIIVLLMVLWGSKRGLVKSVLSLGSLVLSLVLALTLYPAVSAFLDDSVVGDYIRVNIEKSFDLQEEEQKTAETPQAETTQTLNLPQTIEKSLDHAVSQATGAVKETVAQTVSRLAIQLLSVLIVFVLTKLILWLLTALLDLMAKLPVIRSMNKLLGGILGGVYGVLMVYLLLALLTFTTTLKTFNKPIELVLESRYVSLMYDQNILLNFLK